MKSVSYFQQIFNNSLFNNRLSPSNKLHWQSPNLITSENAYDYYSYKLCYFLNCQSLCNVFGQCINVEVKWQCMTYRESLQMENSSLKRTVTWSGMCIPTFPWRSCISAVAEYDERVWVLHIKRGIYLQPDVS